MLAHFWGEVGYCSSYFVGQEHFDIEAARAVGTCIPLGGSATYMLRDVHRATLNWECATTSQALFWQFRAALARFNTASHYSSQPRKPFERLKGNLWRHPTMHSYLYIAAIAQSDLRLDIFWVWKI